MACRAAGGIAGCGARLRCLSAEKRVIAFFDDEILTYSLDGFLATLIATDPTYAGTVPWSVILANDTAYLQNGTTQPLKLHYTYFFAGSSTTAFFPSPWGLQKAPIPILNSAPPGTLNATTGYRYRIAYKSTLTGHVGTASEASLRSGTLVNQSIELAIPASLTLDFQINRVRVYRTLDGGDDFFFNAEVPVPSNNVTSFVYIDDVPDEFLDASERAPLLNDTIPRALYMAKWGARIFFFNLVDENPKFVAYTGFDRITVGQPIETCPALNRIKLDTGANDIAGGGVIDAGVIVFDTADTMYMFRGQPQDITVTAPVEYTLFLRQLPWNIGCAGHFTIQSTRRGLIWLGACLGIYLFNGVQPPEDLSEGAEPILRSINFAARANSRSVYWQYRGRDWYILAIPTGTNTEPDTILIVDLDENQDKNFGIIRIDVGVMSSIGIVSMNDGQQKFVIGQGGLLKEIILTPTTVNGIEQNITVTSATLGAFWESGYIGNESPTVQKFFRYGRVTADQDGIRVKRRLIRDKATEPITMEFVDTPPGGKISTNRKARRMSYELRFRDEDVSQNILELSDLNIPVATK